LLFDARTAIVVPMASAIERRQTMGDKSPKSKQRGQKQKDAAKAESAAKVKSRQDSQSQAREPTAKGKK
jgi:hypothetical protein